MWKDCDMCKIATTQLSVEAMIKNCDCPKKIRTILIKNCDHSKNKKTDLIKNCDQCKNNTILLRNMRNRLLCEQLLCCRSFDVQALVASAQQRVGHPLSWGASSEPLNRTVKELRFVTLCKNCKCYFLFFWWVAILEQNYSMEHKICMLMRLPLSDEVSPHRWVLLLPVAIAYCDFLLPIANGSCRLLLLIAIA